MGSSHARIKRRRRSRARTSDRKLTNQQEIFIHEYVADSKFNATEAAKKAGYKNAAGAAAKLLLNPLVQDELSRLLQKRARRVGVNAERVLRELTYIGLFDPRELFDDDGNMISIKRLPSHVARAIKSIKVRSRQTDDGVDTRIDLELHPKIAALELIAKHLGMLNDKLRVEHGLSDDFLAQLLSQAESKPTEVIDGNYLEARLGLPAPAPVSPRGSKSNPLRGSVESSSTADATPSTRRSTVPPARDGDYNTFDVEVEDEDEASPAPSSPPPKRKSK